MHKCCHNLWLAYEQLSEATLCELFAQYKPPFGKIWKAQRKCSLLKRFPSSFCAPNVNSEGLHGFDKLCTTLTASNNSTYTPQPIAYK